MKIKTQLVAMLVLACSVLVVAQTGMSSDSSTKKPEAMSKTMAITGCVGEKDGTYMLMDKKHPDGVELNSSQDLKPHVGHKVSVTGMMESENAMTSDSMAKGGMAKEGMAMSGFKVNSMKMVSDHCVMPNGMVKK